MNKMNLRKLNMNMLNVIPPDEVKLIMLRNRGGETPPWKEYVKENLVFQLDFTKGFASGDTTTWTDLIGGKVLTLQSGTAELVENGIYLSNGARLYLRNETILTTNECSMEICFSCSTSNSTFYVDVSEDSPKRVMLNVKSNEVTANKPTDEYYASFSKVKDEVYSMSILGENNITIDGEVKSTTRYGGSSGSYPYIEIKSTYGDVTIRSIRIYSNKLTDTQVKQNYMVDYMRFCPVPDGALLTADGKYFRTKDVEWFKTKPEPTYIVDDDGNVTTLDTTGEFVLPSSVDKSTIKSIEIGTGATSLGDFAVSSCISLESITIPDGITSIGCNAFTNCDCIKTIVLPDSVTELSYEVFFSCDSLESVTLPSSVTSIDIDCFGYCESLRIVVYKDVEYTSKSALLTALDSNNVSYSDLRLDDTAMDD